MTKRGRMEWAQQLAFCIRDGAMLSPEDCQELFELLTVARPEASFASDGTINMPSAVVQRMDEAVCAMLNFCDDTPDNDKIQAWMELGAASAEFEAAMDASIAPSPQGSAT